MKKDPPIISSYDKFMIQISPTQYNIVTKKLDPTLTKKDRNGIKSCLEEPKP